MSLKILGVPTVGHRQLYGYLAFYRAYPKILRSVTALSTDKEKLEGHGFCFEARQKRLLIGDTYNFVDLVFYHRILKCHILVELKVGKFTHEHIGQLNTYVSWYTDNEMTEGDNLPVGLLLCMEKDHTVVKYALAGMSNQLFVSKYQVMLPTEEDVQGMLAEVMA